MTINTRFMSLGFLCALAVVSCGGDEGRDDEGSGIDGSKPLSELTPADVSSICDWSKSLISDADFTNVVCYTTAIAIRPQDPGASCEAMVESCLMNPGPIDRTCTLKVSELPPCAAQVTVSEMKACLDEFAASMLRLADTITCDTDLTKESPKLAACEAVKGKCPALLETDNPFPAP